MFLNYSHFSFIVACCCHFPFFLYPLIISLTIPMDVKSNSNGCANASNPYHQCSQACFSKTKGTKPQSNRKITTSGGQHRRSVTDGEIGKKINQSERRTTTTTTANCPKASNPFHTCDANCNNKTLSNLGANPDSKIERKNKVGSKPVLNNSAPAAIKVGGETNNLSNASSTKPQYSENTNDEIIPSSGPISAQLHTPDVMPLNHKDQVKNGAELIPNHKETNQKDKVASVEEIIPITNSDKIGEDGSKDFSFSGTPNQNKEVDTSSEGETDSVVSESRISVGKYNVKESYGSTLLTILDKYGDIGASCHLESVVMRSYYMECVCFVVQELQSCSDSISKYKLNELLGIVKDVESAHLRVAWLRIVLDEIVENIELISHHQDVETEKANYDREMESLREQLQSELEILAQKEKEVADINNRIPEIRDRLSELEFMSSGLVDDQSTLHIKSKIDQLL